MKTPQPPKHLTAAAKRIFREIVDEYSIEDQGGLKILASGIEAWDRAKKAREEIDKLGMMLPDRWGQPKINPLCAVERDNRAQWLQSLKLLKLDIGGESEKTK